MRRLRWLWLLPVLAFLLGATVIVWARIERAQVLGSLRLSFKAHVESVARLVGEATREATQAVNLAYTLAEDSLANAVDWIGPPEKNKPLDAAKLAAEGVAVWVAEDASGRWGHWGSIPEDRREALWAQFQLAAASEIDDTGLPGELGLFCARFGEPPRVLLACRKADELAGLRRRVGLAPLLREVTSRDVAYVTIQDPTGILVSSPYQGELSTFEADPALGRALAAPTPGTRFRILRQERGPLFEGLSPFALPDGSTAVLRVGVDASTWVDEQQRVNLRHQVLFGVMAALVLLVAAGTFWLNRIERHRLAVSLRLQVQEEDRRHWEAIGQMAASVAHEVRNPLNTVQMAAQRLKKEFTVPEAERADYAELVALLQTESDRVNRVVTEFLELGKPLVLNPQTYPVDELLGEAVQSLRLRAEQEGKQLAIATPGGGAAHLDRGRFVQIVTNLGQNALDAIPAGGRVLIELSCQADGARLTIEDNGPGMDPETLAWVQQPFATTKPKGTGLGLPLSRRFVEAHGGRFVISSEAGAGTRVEAFFPGPAVKA